MPGAGILTFSGTLAGFPFGDRDISITYAITSAIDYSISTTLLVGDNPFLVPGSVNGVAIEMPPGNAVVVNVKSPGDATGLPLHRTFATIWMIDTSTVSFVLTAPTALSGPVQLTFF